MLLPMVWVGGIEPWNSLCSLILLQHCLRQARIWPHTFRNDVCVFPPDTAFTLGRLNSLDLFWSHSHQSKSEATHYKVRSTTTTVQTSTQVWDSILSKVKILQFVPPRMGPLPVWLKDLNQGSRPNWELKEPFGRMCNLEPVTHAKGKNVKSQ